MGERQDRASRVRVLDSSVAERIAAGEVVERPASVVKELVENSLDAGARTVTVEIEGAGLRRIRVTDDGAGIDARDIEAAFLRFATSKIAAVEDLETIASYGFRGEALPSIAAISRVTLTSRTLDADAARRAVAAGGAPGPAIAHGAPPGTVVDVESLFFNTPARLKFLKSAAREQALVADVVQRAAMANPDVEFRLRIDGRETYRWPAATAAGRVADLLGAGSVDELIVVDGRVPDGRAFGWLGRPERSRPNRLGQHVFVNRRPIQSALVRRAVEQGYAQLVTVGRFPTFALFLEIDAAFVDVNIHPRKLEVRFRREGDLFGAIATMTRRSLLASPLVRHVDAPAAMWSAGDLERSASGDRGTYPMPHAQPLETQEPLPWQYATDERRLPPMRPLGQVLNMYIVAEGSAGLYVIDQHAAHERVLYERLIDARARGGGSQQLLAVPVTVDLMPSDAARVAEHQDHLAALGFELESFGALTLLIRGIPAQAAGAAPDALVRRAVAALGEEGDRDDVPERLAIATACHTAIRAGDRLGPDAIAALLADLAATDDPFTCFHGRPTVVAISGHELERWFLRG
jgi:DNA mismatch repair protein MutL